MFSTCEPATASCAAHTLTRIPAPHRASPEQAIKCVEKIAARLRLVGLDGAATLAAIQNAAAQNIAGGTIYDSLIATCALQSEADRIYSWNTRHFERFGPEVAPRLTLPVQSQKENILAKSSGHAAACFNHQADTLADILKTIE